MMTTLKKISTGLLATALLTAGVGGALAANDQLAAKLTATIATEITETLPEGTIKMDKINFELEEGTGEMMAIECTLATEIKEGEALPEGAIAMSKINLTDEDGTVNNTIYAITSDLQKDGKTLPEDAVMMEKTILATETIPATKIAPEAK